MSERVRTDQQPEIGDVVLECVHVARGDCGGKTVVWWTSGGGVDFTGDFVYEGGANITRSEQ